VRPKATRFSPWPGRWSPPAVRPTSFGRAFEVPVGTRPEWPFPLATTRPPAPGVLPGCRRFGFHRVPHHQSFKPSGRRTHLHGVVTVATCAGRALLNLLWLIQRRLVRAGATVGMSGRPARRVSAHRLGHVGRMSPVHGDDAATVRTAIETEVYPLPVS
jgi:hypothetical protein